MVEKNDEQKDKDDGRRNALWSLSAKPPSLLVDRYRYRSSTW